LKAIGNFVLENAPVTGQVIAAARTVKALARGDFKGAALEATGALPGVKIAKKGKEAVETGVAAVRAHRAEKKVEGIYEFADKSADGATYVGQSGNVEKRLQTHAKAGRHEAGTAQVTQVEGGRTAREVAEHQRIQEITGGVPAKDSPAVSNKRDPIGVKRKDLLPK
jgi:hypothetical protein